ncbi:autotransporter domain-containing protein [Novosphingobium beihaiensis]|uniref:Autotransporter domain-containing protein n=1 Tax=Novosphingobium beihaiensis TaxID=2930389 RepID=A0ABT0BQA2_9SPHN|nr:autotransporter domain-containing protein [Novosphingobium beihaiensis]MCJ2186869.1 autotransporter domain-containing protein [Novosphingobium beihaiensis]
MKNARQRKLPSRQRIALLGSAATLSLLSVQAHAQSYGPEYPSNAYLEAQSGGASGGAVSVTQPSPQRVSIAPAAPVPQIVIADPGTSGSSVDPTDINGVGQMIIDQQNGFVGICTATLINPRTVVFAAHCVNEEAPGDYGAATGGTPIGFGFSNDNLAGLRSWFASGYGSDAANAFYNADYVNYHPGSLEPDAVSFLYSDVAVASLDTPAEGIPTWALLFSQLPAPDAIDDVTGTGYHVTLTGYGRNGEGTDGSVNGIDFRRRVAENMLGGLASLDQFENFQFGGDSTTYPQNLYWIDFDDPARENIFDFNAWKDEGLPNEGNTAGGDSGGPLILDDTFDTPVVIGTLSGGYTTFFGNPPQGPNSYGTASFYQPLYLYWDWIVANNPYRYVAAKEGDGAWEDPEHWVTTLDPAYKVIDENGNLVNGLPSTPGQGVNGNDGTFGQACFQWELSGDDICQDMGNGDVIVDGTVVSGSGNASNNKGVTSLAGLSPELAAQDGEAVAQALPAPSIDNGLPGATGFTPGNTAGDRTAGTAPRYYDVTLSAAGTTTLSSEVTIDRFTLGGPAAALDIKAGGSLTSLMAVNQLAGMMRVDGTLTTLGDYFLMTGGLQGSGTINTPFFTNLEGVIAPGGTDAAGTLTFNGNLILTSGSTYLVNIGAGGVSDLIRVNATRYAGDGAGTGEAGQAAVVPEDGIASLGGAIVFTPIAGETVREGDTYTFLNAEGGIQGTFDTASAISAVLSPAFTYTGSGVTVTVQAGLYSNAVDSNSQIQAAFAGLLDRNRTQYDQYADLYGPTDMLLTAELQPTLESWAPRVQPLMQAMGTAAMETSNRFIRDRLAKVSEGTEGGSIAYYGAPGGVLATMGMSSVSSLGTMAAAAAGAPDRSVEGALPDDMSAFFAGGYINGDSDGAPSASPYAKDDFDGYYLSAGFEKAIGDDGFFGVAASWTRMKGDPGYPGRSAKGNLFQLSFYGAQRWSSGIGIDAQINAGTFDLKTARSVASGSSTWDLSAKEQPFTYSSEVGVSDALALSPAVMVTPRVALNYARIEFDRYAESGSGPALRYNMDAYESLQARASLRIEGKGKIKPHVIGTFVHDFKDKPALFGANFVGGVGRDAYFALPSDDQTWGEVGAGISTTGKVSIGIVAETTVGRSDINYQSYRGSVSIQF